jgi:hypothetical protein
MATFSRSKRKFRFKSGSSICLSSRNTQQIFDSHSSALVKTRNQKRFPGIGDRRQCYSDERIQCPASGEFYDCGY